MMLRRKSNNWARLKLALLIPVAAGTLHVFARPEVTRQFTQLTQSESTTIPLESQVFNLESYRKAIGKYLEQIPGGKGLTEEEEITLLKSHATLCPLYINGVGSIMYEGNLISWEKLSEALNKKMSVRYSEKKPLVIFMLNDRKTPPKELEKLFSIVEKAYTANGYSFDSKERPLLLYNGSPKNYASRK